MASSNNISINKRVHNAYDELLNSRQKIIQARNNQITTPAEKNDFNKQIKSINSLIKKLSTADHNRHIKIARSLFTFKHSGGSRRSRRQRKTRKSKKHSY